MLSSHRPAPAWPILVAGGGAPSLVLALALVRALGTAVDVTIMDPNGRAGLADSRAFALSPGAVAALGQIGLWSELAGSAQPIGGMRITDSRVADAVRPDYLHFNPRRDHPLAFMIEAGPLARVLGAACAAAGIGVKTGRVAGFESGPDAVSVACGEDEPRRFALLVAADGARSRLREAAGIGWIGTRYRQRAIVATVAHERDHGGVAIQHFLPGGPFAILPLAGPGRALPHRSSIVWTEDETVAAAILAASGADQAAALDGRFGPELGPIAAETPLASFPLAVGTARSLRSRRFALLGDAGHEIHPLAGQGLNLGLADAASLAEHVADAVRLGLDPGSDGVLAGYERDRRFDAVALAGLTDGLNRLFSNDRTPLRALRDLGLGLVDRAPGLKRRLGDEAAGQAARAPRLMRGEAL